VSSRLLSTLNARISAAPDQLSAACLRAERAAHLARRGEYGEVVAEISSLRHLNTRLGDPRLSAWVHLADGVNELTEGRHQAAIDRFERTRAVAGALRMHRENSVAVSWLAYIAFMRNEIDALVGKLDEVAALGDEADKSAVSRSKMLVGQAFHYAGRYDLARSWYRGARELAVEVGDDVLTSALLFNIASHHVSNYRQQLLRGGLESAPIDLLVLARESVTSYDDLVGINSLSSYAGTLLASIHLFHGRFAESSNLFGKFIDVAERQGLERMKAPYLADLAYCQVKLGELDAGRRTVRLAQEATSLGVHVDDLAATRSRLAQTLEFLGEPTLAAQQMRMAEELWSQHEEFQRGLLDKLARLNGFSQGAR
jgi:tetratricopeptide (TPR) repeat protein